jgi:tetratricopeptide (TPR) repeat protein
MYNIIVSLIAATVATVTFGFLFGGGEFVFLYGIFPGLIVGVGTFFYLARRTIKQVEAIMKKAQPELEKRNVERAVDIMKEAYSLANWQLFLKSQIDGQIGTVLYAARKYDDAAPFLKNSFSRNWVPQAMLAVLYYKKKKFDQMEETFESAVAHNKKQALLWNLYAYCQWKRNKRDQAIDILNRAVEHVENDEKTRKNLKALQNNRKMKMRGWNMQWYQFHLDKPPQQRIQIQGRRR